MVSKVALQFNELLTLTKKNLLFFFDLINQSSLYTGGEKNNIRYVSLDSDHKVINKSL